MVPQGPPTGQQVRLAVVIPAYNERQNVPLVFEKVQTALDGIAHEVVFVDDDSPDGTAEAVRDLARTNPSVRLLRRIGRRGLASATIEGMLSTTAPVIAVMDADLQHDETLLPEMLRLLEEKDLELVIGSRNVEGGSMGNLARERIALSNLGRRLASFVTGHHLRDPMSGFFMLRSDFLNEVVHRTSGVGFKILLDLVASATRPVRFHEIGYQFRPRMHGTSKLDVSVALEYLYLIAAKRLGHLIPVRFTLFAIAGLAGLG
ncbi:MAG: polyprenol monophosphomannose synthase, partial [Bryobacteraceae bacterium]